jgi:hypothetical protein
MVGRKREGTDLLSLETFDSGKDISCLDSFFHSSLPVGRKRDKTISIERSVAGYHRRGEIKDVLVFDRANNVLDVFDHGNGSFVLSRRGIGVLRLSRIQKIGKSPESRLVERQDDETTNVKQVLQ